MREIELDIANGKLYLSKYFNPIGNQLWNDLIRKACEKFDDLWLAGQLRMNGCMAATHTRRTPKED